MSRTWLICLLYFFPGCAVAGDLIPLPFEGNYESRGSVAREQATPEQWRDIPQEVRMRLIRDEEIIELQLEIDVQLTGGNDAPSVHTIFNRMWLVQGHPGVRSSMSTSSFRKRPVSTTLATVIAA